MAVKQRVKAKKNEDSAAAEPASLDVAKQPSQAPVAKAEASRKSTATDNVSQASDCAQNYCTLKWTITAIAFIIRVWRLGTPEEVVFDEVHFGKFASHYLKREFFFDVHPPLGKLLFAFIGWLIGYDGEFKFQLIGDNYIANKVPYIAYRSLPVVLGTSLVPLVFIILQEIGLSAYGCFLGAALIALDSAQATECRLILLDASLLFFMTCSIYCYVKFAKQSTKPFGVSWWGWLLATGVSLSSVISVKYVGVFTFIMIGVAVIYDLYGILDTRGKKPEERASLLEFSQHFGARFLSLLVVPFVLYLWWFYVHFWVLKNSGPGDNFMTAEFQSTLHSNPVAKEAMDIHYYDYITVKSVPKGVFLHSHPEKYPVHYPDGRISSGGQQVTGYSHEDPNNLWQIYPVTTSYEEVLPKDPLVGSQHVMLKHVLTNSFLYTHDVASPNFKTNEEFTTAPIDWAYSEKGHDKAIFNLDIAEGGPHVRSRITQFRLKHVATPVSMWLSDKTLPDWGSNQLEISGDKSISGPGTLWSFGKVERLTPEEEASRFTMAKDGVVPRRSFWTDYWELQLEMFRSNNRLTSSHPYMSTPIHWPMLTKGISFWARTGGKGQIYFIGNHVGWYLINTAIVLCVIIISVHHILLMRQIEVAPPQVLNYLYTIITWLLIGWAAHYLPFFLMGRQLFLHHYLPAHVIGSMLTAAVLDFVFVRNFHKQKLFKYVVLVLVALLFAHFMYFSPLVYGYSLEPKQVRGRQWLQILLHHSKEL